MSVVGLCPVCAWYVAVALLPPMGMLAGLAGNDTALESESVELGAGVRGTAPGAAHEALQSAVAVVCYLYRNFRP